MSKLPPGLTTLQGADQLRAYRSPAGGPEPFAAVQPRSTEQIESLLKWANKQRQALVLVSSAEGPRTHGCSRPEGPALTVDLSAMKRVHNIDRTDAIAVIEPGVTYPEFDAQLAAHGLRSYKPLLPRRSKSVLGSLLEREPMTSPRDQWDGADPLVAVELVFGNGTKFRTGTASSPDPLDEQLKNGLRQMTSIGPYHTDFTRVIMGSQGTLGIVSWASVYCERIPVLEKAYFVPCERLEPLAELSARIGWRKLAAQSFIVNNLQLALMLGADRDSVLQLAAKLPAWTLFANLSALDYFPRDRIAYETEALQEDVAALGLQLHEQLAGIEADRITRLQQDLPKTHYKDRLRCAHDEIFFLHHTDRAPRFVETFASRHANAGTSLPFAVYLQPRVQSSSCHIEFTTFWETSGDGRTRFHKDTSTALADAGAFFSRPYGVWKDIAFQRDAQILPHLRRVKAMFDPNAVLNPGKIC